jgi:hypothetical protein
MTDIDYESALILRPRLRLRARLWRLSIVGAFTLPFLTLIGVWVALTIAQQRENRVNLSTTLHASWYERLLIEIPVLTVTCYLIAVTAVAFVRFIILERWVIAIVKMTALLATLAVVWHAFFFMMMFMAFDAFP